MDAFHCLRQKFFSRLFADAGGYVVHNKESVVESESVDHCRIDMVSARCGEYWWCVPYSPSYSPSRCYALFLLRFPLWSMLGIWSFSLRVMAGKSVGGPARRQPLLWYAPISCPILFPAAFPILTLRPSGPAAVFYTCFRRKGMDILA